MSLILKGIDMPKETDGLSITFHCQDEVTETHILDVTQAVQIPKGHGNIKDVDKIKLMARLGEVDIDRIDNAPTILEAEEADENQV